MAEIYLNDIAHGRSGDKGDTSNVCVYARKPEYYKIIEREVTPEKLKAYFGDMVKGEITRYDVPSLGGFNFVMKHVALLVQYFDHAPQFMPCKADAAYEELLPCRMW